MFDDWDAGKSWGEKVDELERRVLANEAEISRLRAEQADDLRILDQLQVDLGDGDRCMDDWVQAHLDVSHQTAARLMQVARSSDRSTVEKMTSGSWGLDRASLLLRLAQAGATADQVTDAADNYSLGRIYGLILELKEISPLQEQASFEDRYLVIQPNLVNACPPACGGTDRSEARSRGVRELRTQPNLTAAAGSSRFFSHDFDQTNRLGPEGQPATGVNDHPPRPA